MDFGPPKDLFDSSPEDRLHPKFADDEYDEDFDQPQVNSMNEVGTHDEQASEVGDATYEQNGVEETIEDAPSVDESSTSPSPEDLFDPNLYNEDGHEQSDIGDEQGLSLFI